MCPLCCSGLRVSWTPGCLCSVCSGVMLTQSGLGERTGSWRPAVPVPSSRLSGGGDPGLQVPGRDGLCECVWRARLPLLEPGCTARPPQAPPRPQAHTARVPVLPCCFTDETLQRKESPGSGTWLVPGLHPEPGLSAGEGGRMPQRDPLWAGGCPTPPLNQPGRGLQDSQCKCVLTASP